MWDERYAGDEYLFGTEPNAFLLSQQALLKQGGNNYTHCRYYPYSH